MGGEGIRRRNRRQLLSQLVIDDDGSTRDGRISGRTVLRLHRPATDRADPQFLIKASCDIHAPNTIREVEPDAPVTPL